LELARIVLFERTMRISGEVYRRTWYY